MRVTIDSFWSFSTPKYFLSREFKFMFMSLGSSDSRFRCLWAICESKTLSQWTPNCFTRALVSSQKSWKILTTFWSSRMFFKPSGKGLTLARSKMKQCCPKPIYIEGWGRRCTYLDEWERPASGNAFAINANHELLILHFLAGAIFERTHLLLFQGDCGEKGLHLFLGVYESVAWASWPGLWNLNALKKWVLGEENIISVHIN